MLTSTASKVSKYGVFLGPYFPAIGLNTERYSVSLRIQSECRKIQTRKNFAFERFSHSGLSKVSWKFRIPTIYNSAVISPWNLLFLKKVTYFSVYTSQNLKTGAAVNAKISVFVICVEVIIYFLLYKLHDFTL